MKLLLPWLLAFVLLAAPSEAWKPRPSRSFSPFIELIGICGKHFRCF